MDEAEDRLRQQRGQRRIVAVAVALISSGTVSVAEIVIGLVFRLDSVLAEGLHTLADMLDSVVALFAVRQAARPPARSHPGVPGPVAPVAGLVGAVPAAPPGGGFCWPPLKPLVWGQPRPEFS